MVKPLDPLTQVNKCLSALGYFISQISASLYSGGKLHYLWCYCNPCVRVLHLFLSVLCSVLK